MAGVLYVISATFLYLQQYLMSGVAQNTVYALRRDVEAEVQPAAAEVLRLAHARRDPQPRRQRPGQHQQHAAAEPDAADHARSLTVVGIIIMMLTISLVLTLVVVLTLPLSVTIVATIAKRSQAFFMRQQKALGEMNGHVAEMYSGHTIVTAFGHEEKSVATFDEAERDLLRRRVARAVRRPA